MLIREPDYYGDFHCLAGACPHTCCEKWEVVIDEDTALGYFEVPGPLGEKLRETLRRDEDGDWCFPLDGGRCPFLNGENLCDIHCQLGEAATSETCREHPRFIEDYGPFREVTLSASCPAANALLLGTDAPLTFRERRTPEPEEPGDEWLACLLPLRDRLLAVLAAREHPLAARLAVFLDLAAEAQLLLDEEGIEALPALAADWTLPARTGPEGPGLFPGILRFLRTLEALEPDWRGLLARAEAAPPAKLPEPALERLAVYFAFRYLLKAVNDGDLLGRAALCVFLTLTAARLAAVCGLPEAARRLSCELEHSDENLEAVRAAFWQEEGLSLSRLWEELAAWRRSLCDLPS